MFLHLPRLEGKRIAVAILRQLWRWRIIVVHVVDRKHLERTILNITRSPPREALDKLILHKIAIHPPLLTPLKYPPTSASHLADKKDSNRIHIWRHIFPMIKWPPSLPRNNEMHGRVKLATNSLMDIAMASCAAGEWANNACHGKEYNFRHNSTKCPPWTYTTKVKIQQHLFLPSILTGVKAGYGLTKPLTFLSARVRFMGYNALLHIFVRTKFMRSIRLIPWALTHSRYKSAIFPSLLLY